MNKNSIAKLIILLLCICCLFTGCKTFAPKSLYKSDTVEVVRNGNKTAVYDIAADKEYNYITKRVKRSKAITEPYTTVDTDTIKIDIIPSGLSVYDKAKSTVFTVKRNYLRNRGVKLWR
mgnify:CR=1 FL=1